MRFRRKSGDVADVDAEAAAWLARLHADDRSASDERAFQVWLEAPAHKAAFDHLTAIWETAGGAARGPDAVGRRGHAESLNRRAMAGGAGLLVLASAGGLYWTAAAATVYETDVGEQKHVSLSDGSLLFLDTDTKLRVRYSTTQRMVDLVRGRCNFRVTPDPRRPFIVAVASKQVIAPAAAFDVRTGGNGLQVVCIQGDVGIVDGEGPRGIPPQKLRAGEQLLAIAAAPPRIDTADIGVLGAWQRGQLVFDDEPLRDAISEMNRYSTTKLVLAEPNVGDRTLSGVYRTGDNVQFARSVAQLLNLHVELAGPEIRLGWGA